MAGSVPFRYGVFFLCYFVSYKFFFPLALASRICSAHVFSGLAGWDGDGVGRSCSNTHANQLNRFVIHCLMCVCAGGRVIDDAGERSCRRWKERMI